MAPSCPRTKTLSALPSTYLSSLFSHFAHSHSFHHMNSVRCFLPFAHSVLSTCITFLCYLSPSPFFRAQTQALTSSMKPSLIPPQKVVSFFCTAIIYGRGSGLLPAGPLCTAFKMEHCTTPGGAIHTDSLGKVLSGVMQHRCLVDQKEQTTVYGALIRLGTPRDAACFLLMVRCGRY